jgi:hypothetical protein
MTKVEIGRHPLPPRLLSGPRLPSLLGARGPELRCFCRTTLDQRCRVTRVVVSVVTWRVVSAITIFTTWACAPRFSPSDVALTRVLRMVCWGGQFVGGVVDGGPFSVAGTNHDAAAAALEAVQVEQERPGPPKASGFRC